MDPRAAELIASLHLSPHPEGGYYRRVFYSSEKVLPRDGRGERRALSTIYFLLLQGQHSRWHRLRSDEVWHFYEGEGLELLWVEETWQSHNRCILGPLAEGKSPVAVVPAGCWQAARPLGAYALVGCTVGPGFEFDDFELLKDLPSEAAEFSRNFPEWARFL